MVKNIPARYMMATEAHHLLGNISRVFNDLCVVTEEDEENYYGMWVEGFGYGHVRFPKATTRPLNEDEKAYFEGALVCIGDARHRLDIQNNT